MVGFFKRLFRSAPPTPDAFNVTGGSQRIVDARLILNQAKFYAGLRAEEKLTLFRSVYYSVPLANGAANTLVKLVNTSPYFDSGDNDVDARCREIWQALNLSEANEMLCRQGLIYGYGVGEIVWVERDALTLDRIVIPPSYEIRKVPDARGVIQGYLQLPSPLSNRPLDRRQIPSVKVIDYTREPSDSFDYYGTSLYEPCLQALEDLCGILKCQVATFFRLGKPRWLVTLPSEGITPEEFRDRLDKAKSVFASLADNTDIFAPVGVEAKILGADGFGVKYAEELRAVLSMILSSFSLPAALLNVVIQPSVGTESFVRQQVISLQSLISQQQDAIAQAWNTSFWRIVQQLEGFPVAPIMYFERPRLLEQLQEEQARELRFANDLREVTAGIRSPAWLAAQCDSEEIDDPDALDEFIEQQRASGDPEANQPDAVKGES